jgi:hypothetical protein
MKVLEIFTTASHSITIAVAIASIAFVCILTFIAKSIFTIYNHR